MATPFSPFVTRRLPNKPAQKRRQSQMPSDFIDWEAPEIPELEKDKIIYENYIKQLREEHEIEKLLHERVFYVANDCIVDDYKRQLQSARLELEGLKKTEDQLSKEQARVNLLLGQIKMFENNIKEYDERAEVLEKELNQKREAISNLEANNNALLQERDNLKVDTGSIKEYLERVEALESELNQTRHLISRLEETNNALLQEKENLKVERDNLAKERDTLVDDKENWIEEKENLQTQKDNLQAEVEDLQFKNNETTCELNHNLEIYIQKKNDCEDLKKKLDAVKSQLAYYKKLAKNAKDA